MKKSILILLIIFCTNLINAQCAISSAPTNNCSYGDNIGAFALNGVASIGNAGCGSSGYNLFATPVRTLTAGGTFTWSATVGGGYYNQGVGIWIDLNNDGFFATTEFVAASAPAQNHTGTLTIPTTAAIGTVRMRVRCAYSSAVTNAQACTNGIGFGYGETEDYNITIVCPSSIPAPTITNASSTVCAGNSATLTANGVGSFAWTGGVTNGVSFSPATSSGYTVVNSIAACPSITNSATTSISVNANPTITGVSSGSICPGTAYIVSPSGASTYSYITSTSTVTGATATLQPIATTIYTIRGTANGCVSTTLSSLVMTITALSSPTIIATTSPASVCPGISSSLSVSGANSYTWNGVTVASSIVVSPSVTTVYTVAGTGTTVCNGVANVTLFVFPTPTITVNSGTICGGYSLNLNPSGASTYTITGPTGTVSSPVSPMSTTNYTFTGTSTQGCNTSTLTQAVNTVVVNASPTISTIPSTTLCLLSSINLLPTGANTYSINGVATTTAGNVSPAVTTTYVVTGTGTNNCVSPPAFSATDIITIVPLPTVTAVSSASAICIGQATANLTGSGANTYTWTGGLTGSSVAVSPTSTTIYTVTGTSTLSCNNTTTVSVTVLQLPVVSASSSQNFICVGGNSTLTATGANTYSWSNATASAITVVNPSVTSNYVVTGTDLNGCTNTATVAINVNTIVITVVPTSTTVCLGNSVTFTASGATSYTWNGTNYFPTYFVTPTTSTAYTVMAIDANLCPQMRTVLASVYQLPNVTASITKTLICLNESAVLTAGGANTYSWSNGNTTSSISVSPTIDITYYYTVVGTDTNNCIATASQSLIVSRCTGFEKTLTDAIQINVYPNPSTGVFHVELTSNATKDIQVIDLTGRVIYAEKTSTNKLSLNLNAYPAGIYYLKVNAENSVKTIKLIKD